MSMNMKPTAFSNKKRPSPLNHSPASSAGSTSSSINGGGARRRITSPSSPLARLAPDCPASTSSSVGSSSSASMQSSSSAVHQMPLAITKEQRQKHAALESQMKSLYELEYREEVIQYMYEMESQTIASVELIDMQPELAWYMRPYLVDFLIEIHQQYRLRPETLYLAINIVDRYVSKRIVYKKHYQLVGCAALWIASKFEDAKDRVPTVEDLCAVCCSAYDQSAFIQMEGHVLSTIGWCLGHPTAEAWLRIACAEGPFTPMEEQRTQHVARFIMEITLFHRAFVSIKPSDIALACLLLARVICDSDKASRSNERSEVVKIAQMLDAHLAEHLEQVSATVVKKYSPSFYSRASGYAREWYLAGRRFHCPTFPSASAAVASSSAPEIDMMNSSPSSHSSNSSANGEDSDFDEDEVYASQPITPTTSIGSSPCDPFDNVTINPSSSASKLPYAAAAARQQQVYYRAQQAQEVAMKEAQHLRAQQQQQQLLPLPTPANGMQWQMQVVPPTTGQSTFRSS